MTKQEFEKELTHNILAFWAQNTPDYANGGFYGALTNDLQINNSVERSAVLCARILWTFSYAYREFREDVYLKTANHAYAYLTQKFWDAVNGGVYWALDAQGHPVIDRKHTYAQAFAIYGLAEYYRATGSVESLELAKQLFRLIEKHTFDAEFGGNLECRSRTWEALGDMRLSPKDMNCAKSMNTLLHLMEAYTNLLRAWDDVELKARQSGLIQAVLKHVVDNKTCHLKLFFDSHWQPLSNEISYGHDIEASWLLVEAAEVSNEPALLEQTRELAAKMAQAVYAEGRNADGSVTYERHGEAIVKERHWWVQAEAVVGFYNAYQISHQPHFAQAAADCWEYIYARFVDRENGDWFKILDPEGKPLTTHYKIGPWECPYHHGRMCLEMIHRLEK
ncbi:MAG: AGE family epimerase/isomerase [Anaerolineales bacterium]|nr:AGE family epimerase/isomerase [Anaerolineales bacterium]